MYYQIENDELIIRAETAGAQLKSVYSKKTNTEYLWQGDEKYWKGRAYNIFPIVGRAFEGKYDMYDKTYEIRAHGVARYRDFDLIERSATKLVFRLKYNAETLKCYPCKFVFYVIYRLCGCKLSVTYKVENADDKAIAFCLGGHPGFNVPFDGGSFNEYYLQFDEKTPVRQRLLAPSKLMSKESKAYPLDENARIHLSHAMFDDDAVVLENTCRRVTLCRADGKRAVAIAYDDFRYLGLWHTPQTDAPFVCVEPWTGLPSTDGERFDLMKKEDADRLAPHTSKEVSFSVEIRE